MNRKQFLSTGLLALLAGLFLSTGCSTLKNLFGTSAKIQQTAQDATVLAADLLLNKDPNNRAALTKFYNNLTAYIAKGQVTVTGLNAIATDAGIAALQGVIVTTVEKDALATAQGVANGLKISLGL